MSPSNRKTARRPNLDTLLDFEVQRCTRCCASTGEPLAPGEAYYSVLEADGADVVRRDYSEQAWQGPPEEAVGWWKSRMRQPDGAKLRWAPNDVMLDLFLRWANEPAKQDIRYVLTLLLVRRRVMKLEGDGGPSPVLRVYCPRREESYQVPIVTPSGPRVEEIQGELAELLFGDAA